MTHRITLQRSLLCRQQNQKQEQEQQQQRGRQELFGSHNEIHDNHDDDDENEQQRHVHRCMVAVPILGLGCSSFSTIFWNHQEEEDGDKFTAIDKLRLQGRGENTHHPIIQEWIDTVIFAVVQAGIRVLDTAPWYGHGTSEIVVGWALQRLHDAWTEQQEQVPERETIVNENGPTSPTSSSTAIAMSIIPSLDELIVNTKVGRYEADPVRQFDFSYSMVLQSVQRSLHRLHPLQVVSVLQLHDPEFAPTLTVLMHETIPAMLECQRAGYCKALGMTGYPFSVQHLILHECMQVYGRNIWDQAMTYGHYNLHDRSLFDQPVFPREKKDGAMSPPATTTESAERPTTGMVVDSNNNNNHNNTQWISFADDCDVHGWTLLAAAPLSMGLLTAQGPPSWHPAPTQLQQACRNAAELCQQHGVDIATLSLMFALSEPRIPCTILGMKNVDEVMFATRVAQRLEAAVAELSKENTNNQQAILKQALTDSEWHVLQLFNDTSSSPFAPLWRSGEYQWDGIQVAKTFWSQIPTAAIPDWYPTILPMISLPAASGVNEDSSAAGSSIPARTFDDT